MAGSYNLGTAEGLIRIKYDGTGTTQAQQGFQKTEESAKKSGASIDSVGTKAAIAGGVIAAGIGYATSKAIDFEHEISAIAAVSGATNDDLDALRKKALQLGADTVFSASEAAQAMEELAKAGVSTKDILNGAADAAVALAAAGGVSLPEAATISANAMNSFNIAAKDLSKVADLIAGAANASAIDVSQFGLALQQVGAVAHLAGVSFDDTAVAIAELGNAGIKGSDAGTSLKTFLQNLIPQTKTQIALFDQLGITTNGMGNKFFDAQGKAKGLADISQVLQNATKGMSKEQQLATLQVLFGSDAIRAAAILADQGADGFNKLSDAMGKTTAADVAAKRMDNAAGQIEQLKGSVETAGIAFGELLLPHITQATKALTQFANFLNNLSPTWKTVILDTLGVVSGLLLFAAGLIKIISFAKALGELAKVIRLVALAQKIWNAVTVVTNLLFAETPIGWIVLAIAALVAIIILVIKYHRQIWDWIKKVWGGFLDFLRPIGAWFAGPFANFFIAAWKVIVGAFDAAKNTIVGIFNAIGSALLAVYNTVIKPVVDLFAPLFQAAFKLVVDIFKLAWDIITALVQVAITIVRVYIETELKILQAIWNVVWTAISAVVQFVWGIIVAVVRAQVQVLQAVITAVVNAIRFVWDAVWNAVATTIRVVWGFIGPYVQAAILIVQSAIQSALNVIQTIWNVAWSAIRAVFQVVMDAITAIVRTAIGIVVGIFDGLRAMVDKVRGFFQQLRSAAEAGPAALISFVAGIPGRIIGALGNLGSLLYQSGRNIIQGLIDGILSMAQKVYDTAKSVLQKARNLLPFSPAKEGPFSGRGWTLYSGAAITQALADGIAINADKAVEAMRVTVSGVANVAAANNPLMAQFNFAGGPAGATAGLVPDVPVVNVQPQVVVVADLGNGVRQVVRSEVSRSPDIVAAANATGKQTRQWAAPGRG